MIMITIMRHLSLFSVLATVPLRLIITMSTRYYSINGMVTIREMNDEIKDYMDGKSKEFKGQAWKKKYPYLETEQDVGRFLQYLVQYTSVNLFSAVAF